MTIYRGGHTLIHSETGSGKTLAFLLPILTRLHASRPAQLLIVVPSRELALQTAAVIEAIWPHHGTQRAFVLAGTPPPAELVDQWQKAACPVTVATPRPLLTLVRHLAGTDRLHSRRALSSEGLAPLTSRLRAIVLDEADALLLDRELAIAGARRKSYEELSGGSGAIKAPEKFTKPAARAIQALVKVRPALGWRGGRGRGGRGRGGRGGRGGRSSQPELQLVACSATASYRLREELCRLFEVQHEAELSVISPADAEAARAGRSARGSAGRGLGGISCPPAITHWWMPCSSEGEKAEAAATVLKELAPRCALAFLDDDAPLRATVAELRAAGVDAAVLHEAMGLSDGGESLVSGSGYNALRSALPASDGSLANGRKPSFTVRVPVNSAASPVKTGSVHLATADGNSAGDVDGEDGPVSGQGCRLLVSTTSSARGLDLEAIDCVLLFSLPASADAYLHLAGRTGRQGRDGAVVSLLAPHETGGLGSITRQLRISIKQNAQFARAMVERQHR